MLRGRPITMPATCRAASSFSSASASSVNFSRRMVWVGVALPRITSEIATPMVLVPRSSPASAPLRGRVGQNPVRLQSSFGHPACSAAAFSAARSSARPAKRPCASP